mgnify:CR=1 FL=1
MIQLVTKLKPKGGFSNLIHIGLTALLSALVFVLVRLQFVELAVAVILLSKWRMLAVKPRHWAANIRANAVDITVGLSFLIFMTHSSSQLMQLFWAVLYGIWLVAVKPRSKLLGVTMQAFIAQFVGLSALFLNYGGAPLYVLVMLGWLICYSAARHFFTSFDEPLTRYLSNVWGYFAAALIWVLGHWLLFYGVIAQPTLLLCAVGFGLAGIYYLNQTDRLSLLLRRQLIFVMIAIVVIVLVASDWGDKTI